LRKADTGGKLKVDHYWFHTNTKEGKIYLTFWDTWTGAVPTIHFGIDLSKNNQCYLHLHDVNEERVKAITKDLAKSLKLSRYIGQRGKMKDEPVNRWSKNYPTSKNFIENLTDFLDNELPFINSFIHFRDKENKYFLPFPENTFKSNIERIQKIRANLQETAKIDSFDTLIQSKLRVKSLHLENINAFSTAELLFEKPVTCFVGGNGSGKTTLLRAIALGLVGVNAFKQEDLNLLGIKEAKKDKFFHTTGFIEIKYYLNEQFAKNRIHFRGIDQNRSFVVENEENSDFLINEKDNLLNALIIGFSQQTVSTSQVSLNGYSPKIKDIEALVSNKADGRFQAFSEWLQKLLVADNQLDRIENRKLVQHIFEVINEITGDEIALTSDSNSYIQTKNNQYGIPISLVSQGYRNILAWLGFFMKRLWEYGQTLPFDVANFKDLPAICLIDEIDTYLHPDWQYTILKGVVKHFPNVQFFITSHSPFVLTSVPAHQIDIIELKTVDYQIKIEKIEKNLYGADANRSMSEISFERLPEINTKLEHLNIAIDNNQLEEADSILTELIEIDEVDENLDLAILRAKRLIKTKKKLNQSKNNI
jgi:predicted ATP-binding protein involved in virulence